VLGLRAYDFRQYGTNKRKPDEPLHDPCSNKEAAAHAAAGSARKAAKTATAFHAAASKPEAPDVGGEAKTNEMKMKLAARRQGVGKKITTPCGPILADAGFKHKDKPTAPTSGWAVDARCGLGADCLVLQAKDRARTDQEKADSAAVPLLIELKRLKGDDLRTIAEQLGLKKSGKVSELIERLHAAGRPESVQRRALKEQLTALETRQVQQGVKRKHVAIELSAELSALIVEPLRVCELKCLNGLHASCWKQVQQGAGVEERPDLVTQWWSCGKVCEHAKLPWPARCINIQ
jgi:hypothetical protein